MLTYRELLAEVQAKVNEHGDRLLDLPVKLGVGGEWVSAVSIDYQPYEAATDEYDVEPEVFYIESSDF